ncbi:MAG: DUF4145 domain-containing protein [Verrucomicrobiota bacterium]|jgi:hypothetical protein
MKLNWQCPFCNHKTIVHDGHEGTVSDFKHIFDHGNKFARQYVRGQVIVCPNEQCKEYSLILVLGDEIWSQQARGYVELTPKRSWRLIPDSSAKVFPSYIPKPLLDDYREACLIRDLSAKASATLARRCLQGIIRDFWKVSKPRLVDEIEAIKDQLDTTTWEAIDSVRKVGNIGAHMEKDINLVIDVDPNEAQLLIELIETFFDEWYIARHDREERMKKVKGLAASKATKKDATSA